MKKNYYFLLIAVSLFQSSLGQLNYTFSASSGTYTPIAGTVAALTVSTISTLNYDVSDEGFSNDIPIGFTFKYNNIDYTSINANTNGIASFSNFIVANEDAGQDYYFSTLSDGPDGLSSVRPVIAPLWDDMGLTDTAGLTYATSGTAPSRVFTLQWADVKWPFDANASSISFQVKLYETTNVIEFMYDAYGADDPGRVAAIGITAAATGTNNFLSLNNTSVNPTVSSTTETNTINTLPVAGQIYRFTPMGPSFITGADGNWNQPGTWIGGVVPNSGSAVIVRHKVSMTTTTSCYSLKVEPPAGNLTINTGVHLTINH